MKETKEIEKRLQDLEEQIKFVKAFISLQLGQNQLDSSFEDWRKKQGVFRSNQLRR